MRSYSGSEEDAMQDAMEEQARKDRVKALNVGGKRLSPDGMRKEFEKQIKYEDHLAQQRVLDEKVETKRRISDKTYQTLVGLDDKDKAYKQGQALHPRITAAHDAYYDAHEAAVNHRKKTPAPSSHPAVKAALKQAGGHPAARKTALELKHAEYGHKVAQHSHQKAMTAVNRPLLRGKRGGMYYVSRSGSKVYAG